MWRRKFATDGQRGLWRYLRCSDYEFKFKHVPSRTAILVILVNGGGLNPTHLDYNTKILVLGSFYYDYERDICSSEH